MSLEAKSCFAPAPFVTRGRPVVLGGDPKGKNILFCSGKAVVIKNLQVNNEAELYYEHSHNTTVAKYAPSGFYIASGDVQGNIRIWDTTQKEHPLKIELKVLGGAVLDIAWSGDSQRLAVVGDGSDRYGAVIMWDSGTSVGQITGHSQPILSVDFRQARPFRVATGSEDNASGWFPGPPFKFEKSIKDHTKFVNCVRFSPDGEKVVTVGADKKAFIYDGKTGDKVLEFDSADQHKAGIYGCAWSKDNSQVLTVSADKTAKLWTAATGKLVQTFQYSDAPTLDHQQLGCLWQGDNLISVALNGDISILDPSNSKGPKRVILGHQKNPTSMAFDGKGSLYVGAYDGKILKFNAASGDAETLKGSGHSNQVQDIHIQADQLFSIGWDDTLRITSLATDTYGAAISTDGQPQGLATGSAKGLAVVVTNKSIQVVSGGKVASTLAIDYSAVAVAISPNDAEVAVGCQDNKVRLYSLSGSSLTLKKELTQKGIVAALAYSPDGKFLAAGDRGRYLFVWDASSYAIVQDSWCFHTGAIASVAWAADGAHIASLGLDGMLFVWDLKNPSKRLVVKGAHPGGGSSVVWVDPFTVATTGADCAIKQWAVKFH